MSAVDARGRLSTTLGTMKIAPSVSASSRWWPPKSKPRTGISLRIGSPETSCLCVRVLTPERTIDWPSLRWTIVSTFAVFRPGNVVDAAGGVRSPMSALTFTSMSCESRSYRGKTTRSRPNVMGRMLAVRFSAMGKFCSPPFENFASLPLPVMSVAWRWTFAHPRWAATSRKGRGWLTTLAVAVVVAFAMKSNVSWLVTAAPPIVDGQPTPTL